MTEREPILPFVIGLVIAVAAHLAAVPVVRAWMVDASIASEQPLPGAEPPPPPEPAMPPPMYEPERPQEPEEPKIGQLNPSIVTTMNLITYEDYRELKARQSEIDQPAVQMTIEPDPMAQQAPLDATPPNAVNPPMSLPVSAAASMPAPEVAAAQSPRQPQQPQQAAEQQQESEESSEAAEEPAMPAPRSRGYEPDDAEEPDVSPVESELDVEGPGTVAMDMPRPSEESEAEESAVASAQQVPVTPSMPAPAAQVPPAMSVQPVEDAKPTVAPKEDYESEPVTEVGYAEVRPGGVLSVQGVKIKTVAPRFSEFAKRTIPRDPAFMIVFSPDGKVIHVSVLQSTGQETVDSPILNALYKWTAEGNIGPEGLTIKELHVLLGAEEDEEAAEGEGEAAEEGTAE